MTKYGPSRGELRFRLGVSLLGLGVLVYIILTRGLPSGPAFFEVVGIGAAFFGGSAIWATRALWKLPKE